MTTDPSAVIAQNPRWYHAIELAPGVVTPGLVDLREIAPKVLPDRLEGLRALDVGTFDGFWAFELEKRGAEVVALDLGQADEAQWSPPHRERLRREAGELGVELGLGFRLAAEALGSSARRVVSDVTRVDAGELGGAVDVVFCGALLLHLRDPVGALERLHGVLRPGGRLVLLEPVSGKRGRTPSAEFQALGTPFNWWVPNPPALEAWVRTAGFSEVRRRGFHKPSGREHVDMLHLALEADR